MTKPNVPEAAAEPDRCADIAAALHLLALKFTDLIGTGVPVPYIQLWVQPGRHGDDESVVAAVDAVSSALLGHGGVVQEMSDGTYHYANGVGAEPVGAVSVRIFKPVSAAFAAERKALAVPNYGRGDEARTGEDQEREGWTVAADALALRRDRIASGKCGTPGCPAAPRHDGDCNVPAGAE